MVQQTMVTTTIYSVWDGDWALLEEYDNTGARVQGYVEGYHGLVKTLVDNIYYYQDELGSTSHIANASGALLEYYKYDLYGKPTYFSPNNPNQPLTASTFGVKDLFTGQRWVVEIGLYDDRNRFMSPDLGRFLQPDPIGFKGDASNLYRYCGNDWANRSDPMGLQGDSVRSGNELLLSTPTAITPPGDQTATADRVEVTAQNPTPDSHQLSLESRNMLGVQNSFSQMMPNSNLFRLDHGFDLTRSQFGPAIITTLNIDGSVTEEVLDRDGDGISDLSVDMFNAATALIPAKDAALIGAAMFERAAVSGAEKMAAKQAAKAAFKREAGALRREVMRDTRHGGTMRIKGVKAGNAGYRPKLDGRYSVTPQEAGGDVMHFPSNQ